MFVRDVMTYLVRGVSQNACLPEAACLMRDLDIGFLPVLDGTRIIGVITDRDIVTRGVVSGRCTDRMLVSEIMTPYITTILHDEDIHEAAQRMKRERLRRLLVADGKGGLIGVVSLADLATGTGDNAKMGEVLEQISQMK